MSYVFTPVETGDTIEAASYNALGFAVQTQSTLVAANNGPNYIYVTATEGGSTTIPPGTNICVIGTPGQSQDQLLHYTINVASNRGATSVISLRIIFLVNIGNTTWTGTFAEISGPDYTARMTMPLGMQTMNNVEIAWVPEANAWLHFGSQTGGYD